MKNNVDTILFDVDGTLVDTDMLVIRAYLYLFDKYRPDYKLTFKELSSFLGPTLIETFPKYFKEDFKMLLHEFHEFSANYIARYAKMYDGLEDTLALLKEKGYKLGIVTSRYRNSLDIVLNAFPIAKYFSCFITLSDVTKSKPNRESIDKALENLNSKKEHTIFVGDASTDIECGINAGVKTCLVSWSHSKESFTKADYILSDYHNLFKDLNLKEE